MAGRTSDAKRREKEREKEKIKLKLRRLEKDYLKVEKTKKKYEKLYDTFARRCDAIDGQISHYEIKLIHCLDALKQLNDR